VWLNLCRSLKHSCSAGIILGRKKLNGKKGLALFETLFNGPAYTHIRINVS
jgi:hypothetical protein